MCKVCQTVIARLNIDLDRFFADLQIQNDSDKQQLICESLLGYKPQEIAKKRCLNEVRQQLSHGQHKFSEQQVDREVDRIANSAEFIEKINRKATNEIRPKLSKDIYPLIANLMNVEIDRISGNWAKIIIFLLDRYRLDSRPINRNNFALGISHGEKTLLNNSSNSLTIRTATKLFELGNYHLAFENFILAWEEEREKTKLENPELLIGLLNCWLDRDRDELLKKGVEIYAIAVVVPISHNHGIVAKELLRGISQIQLQANLEAVDGLSNGEILKKAIALQSHLSSLTARSRRICLQILIVNEDNNLTEPVNQTAEKLAASAQELKIIAVIGHYSSEMTEKAVRAYAEKGLVLINPSSTSDRLSTLAERDYFFRLTTPDRIATQHLARYLTDRTQELQKLAILYNESSIYSQSYRDALYQKLQYSSSIQLLENCGHLHQDFSTYIKPYIEAMRKSDANVLVIIPDGGIEPRSLYNAELIGAANINNCLIIGSATFYQQNILDWLGENISSRSLFEEKLGNIIFVVPWHWHSRLNGCHTQNFRAVDFCRLGSQLWGEEKVTWRSATAYDSMLILIAALEREINQNSETLQKNLNHFFKQQHGWIQGVTGKIEFDENGDRLNPPTEIVTITWVTQKSCCEFIPLELDRSRA
ncbi:MAG: ABC transporter substrate-binding protein [Cyanosarcina radialis HA8281-LM2]|jgi:ABC-type branched-subunit amino acid transport system substrate-binding protein|nr:ABC transporter substrate-binding protein [Cyanosarcina radialis HA8281-LM2]